MRHRRSRLGPKILDDHFLDVTILFVKTADRQQGIDALLHCLANPDQDSRGEWNPPPPGIFNDTEALRRHLVGRVAVALQVGVDRLDDGGLLAAQLRRVGVARLELREQCP